MVPKLMLIGLGAAGWLTVSSYKVWTANLESKDASGVSGTARVESVGDDSVKATVNLKGATAGSSMGWAIHTGKCSALGAMLGGGAVAETVQADSTGAGMSTSTLKLELKGGTDYSVVVHGSAANAVTACGELKAGGE